MRDKRSDGKLPAHVITYLTLGLWLFAGEDYEEVATRVTGSLDRFGCWDAAWSVPSASAITQARKRLGRKVFPELFERTCGPVAGDVGPAGGRLALDTARGRTRDGNGTGELIAVLTMIIDPNDAHADELAAAYHQRRKKRPATTNSRPTRARAKSFAPDSRTWSTRRSGPT